MTQIVINTVLPERQAFVDYLLSRLPDAIVNVDTNHDAKTTFLAGLALTGAAPVINLEDDIILTQNFRLKIEAAIAERPFAIIQFFSMRGADLTVGSRWDNDYMMNQCTYFPPNFVPRFLTWVETQQPLEKGMGKDTLLKTFLKEIGKRYWIHVPSLVDHREVRSLIDRRRSSKRQSKTFVEPDL